MDNQIVTALGNIFSNMRLQLDGYSSIHLGEDDCSLLYNINQIDPRHVTQSD